MAVGNALPGVMDSKRRDFITVLSFQLILLILFGVFVRYDDKYESRLYPMFQDVHVMIFIGFGFLMTFLKRYGFSAVGFNFLLSALIIQWAILCEGFYDLGNGINTIHVSLSSLLRADVAAASVLISMGAVLGKTSYVQLLVMGIIEIAVFTANSYLGSKVFKAVDAGDSIFVHEFGAYFGLAVSYILGKRKRGWQVESSLEGSSYTSDLFAMIGTIFLWMFWPSFNSGELEGEEQHRAIINTYLSLASCCVTAYAISSAFSPNRKFDMVHIQNSTLAGGVAIGTAANLMVQPYGALIVGIVAGTLSVIGYSTLTPWLNKTFKVHDTCGVHNLHGMPGVLAGLIGAIMAGIATENEYGNKLYEVFPARSAINATSNPEYPFLASGDGRTAGQQAGYQILAVVVTLVIAVVSGLITGLIVTISDGIQVPTQYHYSDDITWIIHEGSHTDNGASVIISTIPDNNTSSELHKQMESTDTVATQVY